MNNNTLHYLCLDVYPYNGFKCCLHYLCLDVKPYNGFKCCYTHATRYAKNFCLTFISQYKRTLNS